MPMLLLFLGCTSADYTLNLKPVVPLNQSQLYSELESLQVDFVTKLGEVGDPTSLGQPVSGETLNADGPLFEKSYARIVGRTGEEAVAWGRTEELPDQKRIQRNVLTASTRGIGWLASEPIATVGAELTAIGGGNFLLSGGMFINTADRDKATTSAQFRLLSLVDPDSALSFTELGSLPPYPDPSCEDCEPLSARMGHRLTAVGGVDKGLFLLSGGSSQFATLVGQDGYFFPDDLPYATDDIQLYNPETGSWEPVIHDTSVVRKPGPRVLHVAASMPDGGVLLFGGYADKTGSENPTAEVLVPGSREMKTLLLREEFELPGALGAAGASVPEGAVICGGASMNFSATLAATAACVIIRSSSTVESFPSLGDARAGMAMLGLADGRIIATGGAETLEVDDTEGISVSEFFDGYPASSDLLIYENGAWEKLPGALKTPRANHRMTLLPDGKVLIYGGSAYYAHLGFPEVPNVTIERECAELFDPYTRSLTPLEGCPDNVWGPALAADPEYGAVAVGGLLGIGELSAGVAFYPGELP